MKDSEFHALVEERYQVIEEAMDNCDADIDCELNSGVVTLSFCQRQQKSSSTNKNRCIRSGSPPGENGYHFDWKDGQWIENRGGRELMALLSDACSKQSGETVSLG